MNELSQLIARKNRLLRRREVLKEKQKTKIKDSSNSDIVEESDTEISTFTFNNSLRSQRDVTVCSTDDDPSNESINTSTVCLPLDHSFFQPYKGDGLDYNASTNNTHTSDTSSTLREDKHSLQNITENSPIKNKELQAHHSTNNGVTNNIANHSATLSCLPITSNSANCMTIDVKTETENKGLRPRDIKINIISDIVIESTKKIVTDALHSSACSERIIEVSESFKTGSSDVTANVVSKADMDARYMTDLESDTENNMEPFKGVEGLAEVTNCNDPEIPSFSNELHTNYDLPQCSSWQDNFNCFSESNNIPQETTLSEGNIAQIKNGSKKRRVTRFHKTYMDFKLEEDIGDFSSGSSDNWSPKEAENYNTSETKKKARKRTKKTNDVDESNHVPTKKTKLINRNKTRKLAKGKGLTYETISGKMKEARKMKNNPCLETKCPRKCYDIPEERRQALFDFFWGLDDQRKKEWIVQSASYISVKRKRTESPVSRRDKTIEYYINEGESRRQVCQQFLRCTLDVSQTYMLYNVRNSNEGISQVDKRTRHAVRKYDEDTNNRAKKYIEDLPVLPSHYNRPQSTRLYIPQDFKNVTNLYRLYVKYCSDQGCSHLSERLFRNVFNEYNLSFHIPKKDKCKICVKYENNTNVLNEKETYEYQNHLDEKKACYKRAEVHRNMVRNDKSTVMASFDLQKVLNTPHGQSMLLYYSRKYAVYNLTVYESSTQNGFCYTWGESDGKRGSCEIGTCLYRYLLDIDKKGTIEYVIFYCDSCWGQNKNKVILSVFKYFLDNAKNVQAVQVNYLLPGHTYMQVDSMHSVIEREVRKLIVWSPVQWPTFMLTARKTPRPYYVNTLDHTDFINWEIVASEIFTPKTTSDPNFRLKDIRVATIKKTHLNELHVKYTMKDDGDTFIIPLGQKTNILTGRGKGKGKGSQTANAQVVTMNPLYDPLQKLYAHRLPISTKKYNDLKKLCDEETIPKHFVQDYLQLPYINKIDYLNDIIQEVSNNDDETQNEEIDVLEERKATIQKEKKQTNKKNIKGKDLGSVKKGREKDEKAGKDIGTVKKGRGKGEKVGKDIRTVKKGRGKDEKAGKDIGTVKKGRGKDEGAGAEKGKGKAAKRNQKN